MAGRDNEGSHDSYRTMNKLILLLSFIVVSASCSTVKRTYIRDYDEQIELTKQNFPEIYNLYRRGAVIFDKVYNFEKEGKEHEASAIITDKSG